MSIEITPERDSPGAPVTRHSARVSVEIPTLLLICSRLFHGEAGLVFSEAMLTATISLLSYLAFAGFVFSVARR